MGTTAVNSVNRAIDRDAVLDRVGDDEELLCEITEVFLSELPVLLDEIRTAVRDRDAHRLERSAHSLKGSVANFGASEAVQAAYLLETLGRQAKLGDAPSALELLELEFEILTPLLVELATQRPVS